MKEKYPQYNTKMPPFFATIADTGFNIKIPDKILDQWDIITEVNRLGDDALDGLDSSNERQKFAKAGIDHIMGITDNFSSDNEVRTKKMTQLRDIIKNLPAEKQQQYSHHLNMFVMITEKLRKETNPKKASMLRLVEGQIISRLYFDILPDDMLKQKNFSKYKKTIQILYRSANNLDTVFDLPSDYEKGITLDMS